MQQSELPLPQDTMNASSAECRPENGTFEDRRRFEDMVSDLSARFATLSLGEVEQEIERGLARVAAFFQADRCALLIVDTGQKSARVSYAYYAEGVERVSSDINLAELFPWCYEELAVRQQPIYINASRMSALPPEADQDRQSWAAMGVRSNLTIPLFTGESLEHVIVIHSLREERSWPEEYIPRLRLMGEIFANALARKRADEQLRTSEEKFREFFKNTPDYCYILSPEGIILNVNHAALRTLDYKREDLLGKPLASIYAPESLPKMKRLFEQWKADGHITNEEMVIIDRGGRKRTVLLNAGAVRDDQGAILYSTSVQTDITERKTVDESLRESEERFRMLADTTPVMIWMSGIDKLCTYFNQQWLEFTGRSLEQEHDNGWVEGIHPDDREHCLGVYTTAFEKKDPFRMEYRLRRADGVYRLIYDMGKPRSSPAGDFLGYIGSCIDITERKQSEEELRKAYAEIARLKDRLEAENIYLRRKISQSGETSAIIGRSDPIKYVHYRINQVASLDSTVLIVGETGTGKGLVARAVHEGSLRKDQPMIHVNCAVLPANLIESELFGREKGAFTGAQAKQIGRFELANNGTIFLDEIAELPVELQAKLLRVVENGEFERLGDPRTFKVDVRIIASTNRNLEEEIGRGRFREDLFYRLNVFPITVPPLRQRTEDIPLIVDALIGRLNKQMGRHISTVPQEVMRALQSYSWPGNVRELENVIERAVIMSRGPVLQFAEQLSAVPTPLAEVRETAPSGLADLERSHIRKTLEALKWKIEGPAGAAHVLGLKPSTLRTRMKKLNICRPPQRP